MRILVTGGTGLIGSELLKYLTPNQLCILTRDREKAKAKLKHLPAQNITYLNHLQELDHLNDFDAVINLAGEPIANTRWTKIQKEKITSSRWDITSKLVSLIHASTSPPSVFISGSAVGYYGDQQAHPFDERLHVHSHHFTHTVCHSWENLARNASSEHTRVCLLRTGVVLSIHGGALKRMLLPYKLGLGGHIGNGEQYFPWIHIHDMIKAILFLFDTPYAMGTFNLSAPHPVTNKDFSHSLSNVLRRPHFLHIPKWLVSLLMGESSCLLLDSMRAKPKALTDLGFIFRFPRLHPALNDILKNYK